MPFESPSFHADHIGSLLRPERLLAAARELRDKRIAPGEFRALQDETIREAVAFQEALGVPAVTDGEFRRRGWSAGFIEAVEGFGMREGTVLGFHDARGDKGAMPSPYAKQRLRRTHGIATDEFRFLKSVVKRGIPKVTVPAPDVMHFFLGPKSVDEVAYPDIEQYYADLTGIYRTEIAELAALGCRYLQLDDTALALQLRRRTRAPTCAPAARTRTRSPRATCGWSTTCSPPARPAWPRRSTCAAGISRARGWPRAATSRSPSGSLAT